MVSTVREKLSLKKGTKQNLVADRHNLNKLHDHQTRKEYHIDATDRFSVLKDLELSSIDDIWIKIRIVSKHLRKRK